MIDAFYILKENGTLLISNTGKNDSDRFDDLVSGFFAAIQSFSTEQLKEGGIHHVQFKSNRRLYYKDFKLPSKDVVKFVILTSPIRDGGDRYGKWINDKSIRVKWIVEGLVDYVRSDNVPPEKVQDEVLEKIGNLM